jgi:predicted RNase H-like HicB family nuclease
MYAKSKSSKVEALTAGNLARAKEIAQRYQIVIWLEDGEYYGRGVELPLVFGDGETPQKCVSNTRKALEVAVASYLQDGQTPPSPATEGKRDQQVNIRLSSQERLLLETKARQAGASGISDYLRAVALRG